MIAATEHGTPLRGGTANYGRVIRYGETVHRPRGGHSPATHRLLDHLDAAGFTGAPTVLGGDGRTEILTYVSGSAATNPLPSWALTDEALDSVGRLLRSYHRATAGFDASGLVWQREVPARWRGPLVTHNDTHPANVVFRGAHAAALIDFDLAAPGTPAWELAVAACFWAPLREPGDVEQTRRGRAMRRVQVLLDGYGATGELREDVARACTDANRWIAAIIRDASVRGHPAFGRVWAEQAAVYERAERWIGANRKALLAAAG